MDLLVEQIIIYSAIFLMCFIIIAIYLIKIKKHAQTVDNKVERAIRDGVHEPVSLHPVIDLNTCIGSGACVVACPEKDILALRSGKAQVVNASHCVGHGACFHACPVEAISLHIGTEKRGVDLPHVSQEFESNVEGIFIAGELGGMGLIKNGVEQGKQAVDYIKKSLQASSEERRDLIIVGAGPAGISASLQAKKLGLNAITLEQDTLGGTVFTFPRAKVVMTSPMDLPLHGKVQLFDTSKRELLDLWNDVLDKNDIEIQEKIKVEEIIKEDDFFRVLTDQGEFEGSRVLLAIGRRGTPRKLGVPGEMSEKVAYRLLEPELVVDQKVMVVGGGDSAIESAMLLEENNEVILSYRKDSFSRLKPKNKERIQQSINQGSIVVKYNSNVVKIDPKSVTLKYNDSKEENVSNDRIYIFAGGELPTKFLEKAGIKVTTRFGEAILKHKKK